MCEIVGCEEIATHMDLHGNLICYDCMVREVDEEGQSYDDYISI